VNVTEVSPVYLLDSFAFLAYLNNEPGRQQVEAVLKQAQKRQCRICMCMINLGEVLYSVERRRGFIAAQKTMMLSQSLPIKILEVTNELVLEAAHIKASHPLSYADAFAVATAINQKAIVLTGDPEFESVETMVTVEWLAK
jgi:predicted nucleic acid-binding protein